MKIHKSSIYISIFTIFANFSNASLDNKDVQLTSHACYDNCKSQLGNITSETILIPDATLIPDAIQPISDDEISYKRINFLRTGEYLFFISTIINVANFTMASNRNDGNRDSLEKYFLSNVYQMMINIIFAFNSEHFNSFKNNLNYNILYSTLGLISLFASINKTMLNLQYAFQEAQICATYNMFAIVMYIVSNNKSWYNSERENI